MSDQLYSLQAPYIILSLYNKGEDEDIDDDEAQINVYKLEWDEEDVSATLVKSINLPETDDMFGSWPTLGIGLFATLISLP